MNKTCLKCGASSAPNGEYCPFCGAPLARTTRAMRDAWQAYGLRKNLGGSGMWSILWGLMAAVGGIAMLDESGASLVLIGIGLFLIGTGIAAWAAPGPLTLRLDALALLGVGVWNIGTTLAAGDSSQFVWLGVGAIQIIWSIQRFRKYGDFARVQDVPKAFAGEVGALVSGTQRANAAREADVIEFRAQNKQWKARLMPDMVVAVAGAAQEVRFLLPGEFDLQVTGEAQGRGWPTAEIRLADGRGTGTVSPVSAERYAAWRAATPEEPGSEEEPERLATPSVADPAIPATATPEEPGRFATPGVAGPAVPAAVSATPLGTPGSGLALTPAVPGDLAAAPSPRRKWVLIGVAIALVFCVAGPIVYALLGLQVFARGEAGYQAGDFGQACPALDRVVKIYGLSGGSYIQEAKAYQRECLPLTQADADRGAGAYERAAQGYQGYLADYPAGAFVSYAQAGLQGTYGEWSQSLIEKDSYLQAIDVLGLAYAAYQGRPVPAIIQSAFEKALYGLAGDGGGDGQAVIEASWQAICAGEPATSQAVGLLVDAPPRAWFMGNVPLLPDEMAATEPGHFRYAVCLEEKQETVQSCSYMPAGTVRRLQTNWQVVVRDTLTGQAIGSRLFEGGTPDQCPAMWTFTTGSLTGSLHGDRPDAGPALAWVRLVAGGEPPAVVIEIGPPQPPAELAAGATTMPQAQIALTAQTQPTARAQGQATPKPPLPPESAEEIELQIWHNWSGESEAALSALAEQYAAPHPRVRLTLHAVRDQAEVEAGLAAGAIDVLLWSTAKLGEWADQGVIAPLTHADPTWVREEHIDPAASMVIVGDQVYGLPMSASTLALIYNRALLDKQDVPQTTDDLLAQARAWSETDTYFVYPAQIAYFSAGWFHGGQARWADSDCMPNLDVPDGLAAAELIAAFGAVMPPNTDYGVASELFHSGQAPLTLNGPWELAMAEQVGIDYGVAPLPALSATGSDPAPYVDTIAWMIGENVARRGLADEAWALIAVLSGEESQRYLAQTSDLVPTVRAAGQTGWFGDREDLAVFYAQAKRGTVPASNACMTRVLGEMDGLMADLWSGADPAEALQAAQAALEAAAE